MSAHDFFWNTLQESQLHELEERVSKLEEQNRILYEWVQYFRKKEENDSKS